MPVLAACLTGPFAPLAADARETPVPLSDNAKSLFKCGAAPLLAGVIESAVSNRAEVQRYYGIDKFAKIEAKLNWCAASRALPVLVYKPNAAPVQLQRPLLALAITAPRQLTLAPVYRAAGVSLPGTVDQRLSQTLRATW